MSNYAESSASPAVGATVHTDTIRDLDCKFSPFIIRPRGRGGGRVFCCCAQPTRFMTSCDDDEDVFAFPLWPARLSDWLAGRRPPRLILGALRSEQ